MRKWLWIVGSCLISLACLALWMVLLSHTGVQASEPTVTPVPDHRLYLPIVTRNYSFQHREGDWVITGTEIVQNADVLLDGNLTVQSGGSLTLRNTRLTLNGTYNGQYGIRVQAGGAITIEGGNVITATKDTGRFTFVVEPNAGFVMRDSELHGCGWGTPYGAGTGENTGGLAIYTDNTLLEGNLFSNNFIGVTLWNGAGARLSGNRFLTNTWSGISAFNTTDAYISDNVFADSFNGVYLADSHQNAITGNSFSRHFEGAIFSFHGWNNDITGNVIVNSGWVGVELDKVSGNNRIVNNTFVGGANGVNVHHSLNNTIQGNTITGADHAIAMGYANDNLIADNVFSDIGPGFSYGALLVYHSSDNQILNNHIEMIGESSGVVLFGSSMSNMLQSNVITSTFRGLSLHFAANSNTIISNTIQAEREQAIVVDNSSDNLIHHNNFLSSGQVPYDDGRNQWDDGNTGNYWHDYAGTGAYLISPNGVDRYPLSSPTPVVSVPVSELLPISTVPPPGHPTWVVTEPTIIANQAITVEDTLSIEAGGSLTLTQATLWIDGGGDHGGIFVQPGGALYVYSSTIAATEAGGGYLFQALPGSTLILKESEVRGTGFSWGTDWGGLYITTDGAIIEDSLITDTFRGPIFRSPNQGNHRVAGNTIANCYQGMSIDNQSNSLISDNQIIDCVGWGINVSGFGITLTGNTIANLWFHSAIGIDGMNHTVLSNTITNVKSVAWSWGINGDGEGHQIGNNVISGVGGTGIVLLGRGHMVFSDTVTNSTYGISLWQAHDTTLIGNRISGIADWAIGLGESSNNRISNNTLSNSWGGINLYRSSQNSIAGNRISQPSEWGLVFDSESYINTVTGNTIAYAPTGVFLKESTGGNLFHHNNFVNNAVQAWDFGNNQWDSEGRGNYWSEYAGEDADGDGIGDTPYVIPPNGVDRYPLMAPYEGTPGTPCGNTGVISNVTITDVTSTTAAIAWLQRLPKEGVVKEDTISPLKESCEGVWVAWITKSQR